MLMSGDKLIHIETGKIFTFECYKKEYYSNMSFDFYLGGNDSSLISLKEDDNFFYSEHLFISLKEQRKQKLKDLCLISEKE